MTKKKKTTLIIGIIILSLIILFITFIAGAIHGNTEEKQKLTPQITKLNTQLNQTQKELQSVKSNSIDEYELSTIPLPIIFNMLNTVQFPSDNIINNLTSKQKSALYGLYNALCTPTLWNNYESNVAKINKAYGMSS